MSDALVLSLGHNSSAILVRNHKIVCGYETERISGIKSDSRFPQLPIEEIYRRHGLSESTDIYVSHWELFGEVNGNSIKHWDKSILSSLCPKGAIFSVNQFFTHHDAHAWSGVLFAGHNFPSEVKDKSIIVVMDGFGTYGEHMSFYRYVDDIPVLLERKFGFESSLGLLYQYTTAFLGMRQNQDEYKLLAFESHINEVERVNRSALDKAIETYSNVYLSRIAAYMTADLTDPMLNIGALPNVAKQIADMLTSVLESCMPNDLSERDKRIVISYFTQSLVQNVVLQKIHEYAPNNVILVGGLFYNVKLNNLISKQVPGLTCVMPLAGDQGAGLGIYKAINPDFKWPGHLFWGDRTLSRDQFASHEGIIFESDPSVAFDIVAEELRETGFVNVVRGAMEFGPRALCNTSTLALPQTQIAAQINAMNLRTNEMPFAPVMTEMQADSRLIDCGKIHQSLDYMICTRDFKDGMHHDMMGAAHLYPENGSLYSARPQITHDSHVELLLDEFGPLINTSFNFHGVPIVWNSVQICKSHMLETQAAVENPPITVVIGDES